MEVRHRMHPLDKFARAIESKPRRTFKYCNPLQLALVFLLVASCQTYAPLSWFKKEPIYLERMSASNVSLINSDPDTYRYRDNDQYLPPLCLEGVPAMK